MQSLSVGIRGPINTIVGYTYGRQCIGGPHLALSNEEGVADFVLSWIFRLWTSTSENKNSGCSLIFIWCATAIGSHLLTWKMHISTFQFILHTGNIWGLLFGMNATSTDCFLSFCPWTQRVFMRCNKVTIAPLRQHRIHLATYLNDKLKVKFLLFFSLHDICMPLGLDALASSCRHYVP